MHRTSVVIIGGGPSGMLLSHILSEHGIDNVVLEKHTRDHVLSRIRAGVLEPGSVKLLRDVGLSTRLDKEAKFHNGTLIVWAGSERLEIDTMKYTGQQMAAYGQTAITEDLYTARAKSDGVIITEAKDIKLQDIATNEPTVTYQKDGNTQKIQCEFIAGCDGFHGVSRNSIPVEKRLSYEKTYPFGWLAIMSETKPLEDIVYANHNRGFALASQRNEKLSRYYIQCDLDTDIKDWPDDRFWEELKSRFPRQMADEIETGPSIEKSIAPLRSFVNEPMRYGRLFLAGDAAHIVPPTGAKGLNLAFADVFYLSRALERFYHGNDSSYLDNYSKTALDRVWHTARFSWNLTRLLHRFPEDEPFDQKTRESELEYLSRSEKAMAAIAEQYTGPPL